MQRLRRSTYKILFDKKKHSKKSKQRLHSERNYKKIKALLSNVKADEQGVQKFKKAFEEMATTKYGLEALMNMPENVDFVFNEKLSTEAYYVYGPDFFISQQKLIIVNPHFIDNIQVLAHEMRHAHQHKEGLTAGSEIFFRSNDFKNPNEDFVLGKLLEMETRLYDLLLNRELLQQNKFTKNLEEYPEFEFYDNLLKDGLQKGLSKQDAEKYARESFVKAFWTNGKDVNKALFPPKLGSVISNWNAVYDAQAEKSTKRIQDSGSEKTEKAYRLINQFAQRMGVDIPPEYFINLATKEFIQETWAPKEITSIETSKDGKLFTTPTLPTIQPETIDKLDQELKKAMEEKDTEKVYELALLKANLLTKGKKPIEQTYTEPKKNTQTPQNRILKDQKSR